MNIKIKHEANNITILTRDNFQIRIDQCSQSYNFKGRRESQANYIFGIMAKKKITTWCFDHPKSFLAYL